MMVLFISLAAELQQASTHTMYCNFDVAQQTNPDLPCINGLIIQSDILFTINMVA